MGEYCEGKDAFGIVANAIIRVLLFLVPILFVPFCYIAEDGKLGEREVRMGLARR
jgi:hypothetical protein